MPEKLMPRDVKTRWNLTFTMLDFAIVYRKPLDALSGERNNELREYKLKKEDWKIVVQLHNVLKVSVRHCHNWSSLSDFPTGSSRCDILLLQRLPKPRDHNTGHGPYQ
jgi:hypothetical protein